MDSSPGPNLAINPKAREKRETLDIKLMSKNVFLLSEGTYEKADEEEEEIYEVINVHKLKSATPNLKVVNLYGINFVDDSHIEAFSSNCIQVNFCFII